MYFLYHRAKLTEAQAAAGLQHPAGSRLVPRCHRHRHQDAVLTPVCSHSPRGAHALVVALLLFLLSVSAFLQQGTEKGKLLLTYPCSWGPSMGESGERLECSPRASGKPLGILVPPSGHWDMPMGGVMPCHRIMGWLRWEGASGGQLVQPPAQSGTPRAQEAFYHFTCSLLLLLWLWRQEVAAHLN